MQRDDRFASVEKLLRKEANRWHRKLFASCAGAASRDELFQETVVAYCKARDLFNPELGWKFSTYCLRSVRNHMIQYAQKTQKALGILAPSTTSNEDGDETDLVENYADPKHIATDTLIISRQTMARRIKQLPRNVRPVAEVMMNPPDFVLDAIDAMEARRLYARERGVAAHVPSVRAAIYLALGYNRATASIVNTQLKSLAE